MSCNISYEIFGEGPSIQTVKELLGGIVPKAAGNMNASIYRKCFNCLDITSLNTTDSVESITEFTTKVINLDKAYPEAGGVAAVCIYPNFVETAGLAIGNSDIAIASVAGGFPSSQTFIEVKILETAMAVEQGADEIDMVINVGEIMAGRYDTAGSEITLIREELGDDIILKVILESGIYKDTKILYKAAMTAMASGADFIKTSTGRSGTGATPEAAAVMCLAIKAFYEKTGKKIGLKASGGIHTAKEAVEYYTIVENILGEEWLTPALFRIGAAFLANDLLGAITGRSETYF